MRILILAFMALATLYCAQPAPAVAGGRLRFQVVPEPMSLALLGFGLIGVGLARRL